MADRDKLKAQAQRHSALMKGAFAAETTRTVEAAVIYEEGEGRSLPLPEPAFEDTRTQVTGAFAPEALYRFGVGKCLVVDPASFTRPGGAYLDGAFGPEQVLCSESNLFEVLSGVEERFHRKNRDYRRGQLFTDRCAYLPEVTFSRDGDVRTADVLAIAEPLRAFALENHRPEAECDTELARRIDTMLTVAAANGCETLIVNAFACGRAGYPADQVIAEFRYWLEAHPGSLGRLVFSVPRALRDAFEDAFAEPVEEAPAPAVPNQDEEDSEDWRTIELPEGVTLR